MGKRKIFNNKNKQTLTYFGSTLNTYLKLKQYTEEKHKDQSDLINNVDYVAIEYGISQEQKNFQNKLLGKIQKSKQSNSYEYLQVKCYGHVFFLVYTWR